MKTDEERAQRRAARRAERLAELEPRRLYYVTEIQRDLGHVYVNVMQCSTEEESLIWRGSPSGSCDLYKFVYVIETGELQTKQQPDDRQPLGKEIAIRELMARGYIRQDVAETMMREAK